MATLLKVLNNLADIKSAGGVALRVRTQDPLIRTAHRGASSDIVDQMALAAAVMATRITRSRRPGRAGQSRSGSSVTMYDWR
jgi:hypothetical protein